MYGLQIVLGEFGAGKSFYTHRHITSFLNNKSIKIGNYTSPDFDIEFRSREDLIKILDYVYNYKKDSKNLKQVIQIVIDEGPIYFGSREFKTFPKKLLTFLVQLRKLNVHLIVIAQDLKMLDINFRRLAYNVRKYYKMLSFVRMYKDYELLSEDANLNDPLNTIASRPYLKLGPSLSVMLFPFRFFGSLLYDTNELILSDFDIVDEDLLKKYFPYTIKIDNKETYKQFLNEKRKQFLAKLTPKKQKLLT